MQTRILLTGLATLTVCGSASAALSILGTNGDTDFVISSNAGAAAWNLNSFVEAPASSLANVYWDADNNGVFGEAGENSGNSDATLGFTINVTSGQSYFFAMEGFTSANDDGSISFILENTDLSTQVLNIDEGTTTNFNDSNGDAWEADFLFNLGGYGDVVFNGGAPGNGANAPDHQGVLTLTRIPEPGSMALLGLGALALLRRRRA